MKKKIQKIEILNKKKNNEIKKEKIFRYINLFINPVKTLNKIIDKLFFKKKDNYVDQFDYKKLHKEYGIRAVIDARHPADEYDHVTNKQKEIMYPLLKKYIKTQVSDILDFGCGHGRFSEDLSKIFDCNVLGVDTSEYLINLCKEKKKVNFLHIDNSCKQIEKSFDLIFICHVLNGISNNGVNNLASILTDKLKSDGYLFLVEITGKKSVENIWRTRTSKEFINFFSKVKLQIISKYIDIDNEVSIFFGQKIS